MKDTGFVALLNDRDLKAENIGFYKDQNNRRGVSAKITAGNGKDYAIWFLQKDFPAGIYTVALTELRACMIFPLYKYYEGRNLQDVIEFVDELAIDKNYTKIEDITHPWTELGKRILKV